MLSIIVPVFNSQDFIEPLMSSLNEQVDNRFEVIYVDDGSEDNSIEVIKAFDHLYPYKIFSSDSHGPGGARNTGINNASFDYVTFVDSDDYLSNLFVCLFLKKLEVEHFDIVESLFTVVSMPDGSVLSSPDLNAYLSSASRFEQILLGSLPRTSWAKVYSKDFLIKSDIFYPDSILNGEDHVFLLKAYSSAQKISVIYEQLYFWVRRPGSLTQRTISEQHVHDFYAVSTVKKQLMEHKYENECSEYIYDGFVRRLFKEARMLLKSIDDTPSSVFLSTKLVSSLCDSHFSKEVEYVRNNHPGYYYDVIGKYNAV